MVLPSNMPRYKALIPPFPRGQWRRSHAPVALWRKLVETGAATVTLKHRNSPSMRICIFGAGAVGGHFAVRLALAGHDVSCVMRGPHLEAVKARGLTLRMAETELSA